MMIMIQIRMAIVGALFCSSYAVTHGQPKIVIQENTVHEIAIAVNAKVHTAYGVSYPLTYQVFLPPGSSELNVFRRNSSLDPWVQLTERFPGEFFNGVEAVRFDYTNGLAFVSVAFGDGGDSVFIRIAQTSGENIDIDFDQICKYYDNRDAAVTLTADDWHQFFDEYFLTALNIFRGYHLFVSAAIVTEWCNSATWAHIQSEIDSGDVEACAHGRNHLHTPYPDPEYEVGGARQDIMDHLTLPPHSRYGDQEHVPIWVAPYGEYDSEIEAAVIRNRYLVSRLVSWNFADFSNWNDLNQMYEPIGVVHEMGPLWGGITDSVQLNSDFDATVAQHGVYHVMCHPHVLADEWDEAYPWAHLRHISNRTNLWYANLGHLYMYHLLQDPASTPSTSVVSTAENPNGFMLLQNYPNPFNPSTTIKFSISQANNVTLKLYDITGREVITLVSDHLERGMYKATWRPTNISSGVYVYRLQAGSFVRSRSLVLLK